MSAAKKPSANKTGAKKMLTPLTPEEERRQLDERRATEDDRRAFWRPTPDRRREATEGGRRTGDPTPPR